MARGFYMMGMPKQPGQYGPGDLTDDLERVMAAFQMAFHNHITEKLYPVMINVEDEWQLTVVGVKKAVALRHRGAGEGPVNGIMLLADPSDIPTFCHHKGAFENACLAARSLKDDYDIGIGIAKKGMWLSFIFSLMGLPSYDLLSYRYGEGRILCPMDLGMKKEAVRGKRILLLDNDAITGDSVKAVVENLAEAGPECIDLLLLFRHSFITEHFHEQVKDRLLPEQHLGKTQDGEHIIDTLMPIPSKLVRKKMSVMGDFKGRRSDLKKMKVRLSV
jgi:orotate phosphoribosyltransferase